MNSHVQRLTHIIEQFIYDLWYWQKVTCTKAECKVRKREHPQSSPTAIYSQKMSLRRFRKCYFSVNTPEVRLSGWARWHLELVFQNGETHKGWNSPNVLPGLRQANSTTAKQRCVTQLVMLPWFFFFCHHKAILTLPCVGFCQMSIWVLDNEPQQHSSNRLASKRHSNVTSVLDLHFDIPIPRVARAVRRSDAFRHHDAVIQPNRMKVKKVNRLTSQKVPAGGDSTVRQLNDLSSALKGDCDSSLSLSIVTQTISCHEVPFGLTCGQSSSCFESSLILSLLDRASANNVVLYLFKVFLSWFTLLSSIQA